MPLPDASLTLSDFDPEHEALASTREFGSPQQPNIYHDEQDWDIHTSTLDKAFPDFSQLPPSEEEMDADKMPDSDSDFSLEVGRGVNKPAPRLDDSRDSIMSFQNSVRSSSPAVRVDYPTPQKAAPARSTARRAVSENLRKDAQLRRANQAQKEIASPQLPRNQRDQRRTLSEMHAKVRDDYDGSFIGDERPAPIDVKPRSTRFGNRNSSQEIADAIERASRDAYAKETRKSNATTTPRRNVSGQTNVNNMGDTFTRNSFLLPDLPNISELVSGVYEDGTPVFSQNKMRSTRFVSPPNNAADVSLTREYFPVDAVPIPEDEKALFVSLRLLQDKVAELEMYRSDAEKRLDNYREENAALKAGRSRQSDKYAVEDHKKASKRSSGASQSKLEEENIALQNQLDIADRKMQVQEAGIKRLNHDRESAISQLGVAYLETRELKVENEALRVENAELKSQLSRYSGKKSNAQDVESEASLTGSDADESQLYTERSGDLSRSTKDLTSKSSRSNLKSKSRRQEDSRARVSTQVDQEISRLEKQRAEEELFSINVPTPKRSSSSKLAKSETKASRKQPNTSKQRVKRVVMEDVSEPLEATEQSKASSANADDLTLLSVLDESEIAQLRRTLEEERLARKRRSSAPKELTVGETVNSTRQSILKTSLPRKSSLREPKVQISRPASVAGDVTSRPWATSEDDNSLVVPTTDRPRRHSDHSIASVAQRKQRRNIEDMTSAFIVPDITLGRAELAASNPSRLPESTQRALDGITQHNGKNCTVCKNVLPHDGNCNHEPVKVPKPVPVSERMPKPSLYNEDPTMRPSQPPGVALATVLKALEDELAHLKMQLAGYQGAFHKLDASLGKRQRKSLLEKIETTLRDIDLKSDQIYALYDVLESHRNVKEMTEQEMEMTLESIGIDANATGHDITGTSKSSHPIDLDDEDEDDLPWEGIESTAEITGRT